MLREYRVYSLIVALSLSTFALGGLAPGTNQPGQLNQVDPQAAAARAGIINQNKANTREAALAEAQLRGQVSDIRKEQNKLARTKKQIADQLAKLVQLIESIPDAAASKLLLDNKLTPEEFEANKNLLQVAFKTAKEGENLIGGVDGVAIKAAEKRVTEMLEDTKLIQKAAGDASTDPLTTELGEDLVTVTADLLPKEKPGLEGRSKRSQNRLEIVQCMHDFKNGGAKNPFGKASGGTSGDVPHTGTPRIPAADAPLGGG